MKQLLIKNSLFLLIIIHAYHMSNTYGEVVPGAKESGITDLKGLLSVDQKNKISQKLSIAKISSSLDIRLLIVPSLLDYPDYESVDEFASEVVKQWGMTGSNYENYALLVVLYEQKIIRVVTNNQNKGLARKIDKQVVKSRILKDFSKGRFFDGIIDGITELEILINSRNLPPEINADKFTEKSRSEKPSVIIQTDEIWYRTILYGVLAGLLYLIVGQSKKYINRRRLIENVLTSKTNQVFVGLVEVKGTAESEKPLISELSKTHCVQYYFEVEEEFCDIRVREERDENGNIRTRIEKYYEWRTIKSGGDSIPFYIKDDSGILKVDPEGAKLEPVTMYQKGSWSGHNRYDFDGNDRYDFDGNDRYSVCPTGRRRYTETGIPLHRSIYVIGQSRLRHDLPEPEISHDQGAPIFLISTRSEDEIQGSQSTIFVIWTFVGSILAICAPILIESEIISGIGFPVEASSLTLLTYSLLLVSRCFLSKTNRLQWIKTQINNAELNVEFYLKKRNKVIQDLLLILRGLQSTELKIAIQIDHFQNQSNASIFESSESNAMSSSVHLTAVGESYPEIKNDNSFMQCRQQILYYEALIALGLDYYNNLIKQNRRLYGHVKWKDQKAHDFSRYVHEVKFSD